MASTAGSAIFSCSTRELARVAVAAQFHQCSVSGSGLCICAQRSFAQTMRAIAAHLAVISERRLQPSCLAPFGKLVAQRRGTGEGLAVIVGEEIQDTSGPLHGVERGLKLRKDFHLEQLLRGAQLLVRTPANPPLANMLLAEQMRIMPTGRNVKQQLKRCARDGAKLVMLPIHRDVRFEPRHVAIILPAFNRDHKGDKLRGVIHQRLPKYWYSTLMHKSAKAPNCHLFTTPNLFLLPHPLLTHLAQISPYL